MDGRRVAVVTESVASLRREEAEAEGIEVVPVPFGYAGRDYLDGVDIAPGEFYKMLRSDLPPATTSAPSPGAYMEVFGGLAEAGYEVLCVTATARVTRMHEAATMGARLAREQGAGGRIEILDSGTAAMGQGFLALEAARMARGGSGMEEILGRLRALAGAVRLLVTLDTLEYLSKTARIPRLGTLFAQALQVKPIILFGQGEVKPLERPRTRRRAVERLLVRMGDSLSGGGPLRASVQHAAAPEEAERLRKAVEERFGPEELSIHEFSPVMASYTGPGLLGVAFYEEPTPGRAP